MAGAAANGIWRDVIKQHFRGNGRYIQELVQRWARESQVVGTMINGMSGVLYGRKIPFSARDLPNAARLLIESLTAFNQGMVFVNVNFGVGQNVGPLRKGYGY